MAVTTLTGFRTVKERVGHIELDGQRGVDAPGRQPTDQLRVPAERGPAAQPQGDGLTEMTKQSALRTALYISCQPLRSTRRDV